MIKKFKEIFEYRTMIIELVHRDLRGRYKGSVLGFFWTFLNPLLQLGVYFLLFGIIMGNEMPSFYLYLFTGLIPWIFFQTSLSGGSRAIIDQKSLVTKIAFPREVIPISYVTTAFLNMLLCLIVVALVTIISVFFNFSGEIGFVYPFVNPYGESYNFASWVSLPVIWIIQYILCLGVCLITSTITVYLKDMEHILGILSMAWTYLTPIMYSINTNYPYSIGGSYTWIFYLNPMTSIIESYHAIFYYGTWPNMDITSYQSIWVCLAYAIIIFVIGVLVFEKGKRRFAEEL